MPEKSSQSGSDGSGGPPSAPQFFGQGLRHPIGNRVALNVAYYRNRAGMTQQQLADAARVSRATVNLIESGESDPRLSTLELLARALSVDPSELTGEHKPARNHLGEGI